MKHFYAPVDCVKNKTVATLPNGQFLICLESHGSNDFYSTRHWSHYNGHSNSFDFSPNITIVSATKMCNAVALVVEKKDPGQLEYLKVVDPDASNDVIVTF